MRAEKQVTNIYYTGTIELERFSRRSTGWCSSQNHRIVVIPGEMISQLSFLGWNKGTSFRQDRAPQLLLCLWYYSRRTRKVRFFQIQSEVSRLEE